MKFSCCIEMLFCELPFPERVAAARDAGFEYVEFWTWKDKDLDALEAALQATGMKVSVFQGNTIARMVDPQDADEYVRGVEESLPVAKRLGAGALFLMSDVLGPDRSVEPSPNPLTAAEKREATLNVLRRLAPLGEKWDVRFLIEPLNTLVDHMGYSLSESQAAFSIAREVDSPFVRVLYDAYHMQIMEGNIISSIRDGADVIGHVHVADVPGRHQPGTGEMNYRNILNMLEDTGYDGPVGFEFTPLGESRGVLESVFAGFRQGGDKNG